MTTRVIHYDEASQAITEVTRGLLGRPWLARAAVLDDLLGRFHLLLWLRRAADASALELEWPAIQAVLQHECGERWTGRRSVTSEDEPSPDDEFCQAAWASGLRVPGSNDRLRYSDRHRSRTSWFMPLRPLQRAEAGTGLSRTVAFYSHKGGVGRTTAAASFVLHHAKAGKRIVAIDLDLDAPGLGRLLTVERDGVPSRWGTVDYLVEYREQHALGEYRHVCARSELVGDQPVDVFPVGTVDEVYLRKLAKIDLDLRDDEGPEHHPIGLLLARIRAELQPDLIVVDCRAGLSPIAGFMLSPLADVHVLFSTASEQALDGLARVVDRLGADRLEAGLPQAECVLVQAMLPGTSVSGDVARRFFEPRVEEVFRNHYYRRAAETAETAETAEDDVWTLDDMALPEAPHRAIAIPYREPLADFRDLADVAEVLQEAPYRAMIDRVAARLAAMGPFEDVGDA